MTPKRAVQLALANIKSEGLDDVLPQPLEIDLLKKISDIQFQLIRTTEEKLKSYFRTANSLNSSRKAFDQIAPRPLHHVLVPKKEAFDYRKIAIIHPEDLALYQATAIMIAERFEKLRHSIARGRIYSYRFRPNVKNGKLFNAKYNIRSFQSKTVMLSKQKEVNYIVRSDIANFYDRINLHRLESTLLAMEGLNEKLVWLMNHILLHWARRDSYGIPIGSNASRILAEIALLNVDRALREAKIRFVRFVDDYRIFTKTASEAHSALAMLIDLLDREGLFINARKSSIERLEKINPDTFVPMEGKVEVEKIGVKEFRINAGYGGVIPIKYRMPTKKSQEKYLRLNLVELIDQIKEDDFAQPEQLRDLLYAVIIQEEYGKILIACNVVEMFPQFYPLLVDMLVKNADHIPDPIRKKIISTFTEKIRHEEFLPEFVQSALVTLVGSTEFFDRNAVIQVIRGLRRNSGIYLGRTAFDAAQNLDERADALEIREYFDRSNEWERRRIIQLMKKVLPEPEYRAWRRAIRTYVADDPFAMEI